MLEASTAKPPTPGRETATASGGRLGVPGDRQRDEAPE